MSSHTKTNSNASVLLKEQNCWQTILYNCDCHEFQEVVDQIMLAIKCTETTAWQYATTAHNLGSVAVFKGEREKCESVADVLGSIGLNVKVLS